MSSCKENDDQDENRSNVTHYTDRMGRARKITRIQMDKELKIDFNDATTAAHSRRRDAKSLPDKPHREYKHTHSR